MKYQDSRTELAKARGLGSGKSGVHHFWLQRVTSFANVPLFIFFVGLIAVLGGKDYAQTHTLLANPLIAAVMLLIVLSGIYHMMIGMQVIIEDYIPAPALRVFVLMLNIFCSALLAAAAVLALVKIMSGG